MSNNTALQELISRLNNIHTDEDPSEHHSEYIDAINRCRHIATELLEKEKQQIINARISVTGLNHASPTDDKNLEEAEKYYNDNFKHN